MKLTITELEQYLSKAAWILKGPVDASDFKKSKAKSDSLRSFSLNWSFTSKMTISRNSLENSGD